MGGFSSISDLYHRNGYLWQAFTVSGRLHYFFNKYKTLFDLRLNQIHNFFQNSTLDSFVRQNVELWPNGLISNFGTLWQASTMAIDTLLHTFTQTCRFSPFFLMFLSVYQYFAVLFISFSYHTKNKPIWRNCIHF